LITVHRDFSHSNFWGVKAVLAGDPAYFAWDASWMVS